MPREQMSPSQQPKEESHNRIGDLLCSRGIHVEEAETEVGGKGGVDGAVGGAKAKDELVRAEAALGGAWEVGEGVEYDGGGRLDFAIG